MADTAPKFALTAQHVQLALSVIALSVAVFTATSWFVTTDAKAATNAASISSNAALSAAAIQEVREAAAAESATIRLDLRDYMREQGVITAKVATQMENINAAINQVALGVARLEVGRQNEMTSALER